MTTPRFKVGDLVRVCKSNDIYGNNIYRILEVGTDSYEIELIRKGFQNEYTRWRIADCDKEDVLLKYTQTPLYKKLKNIEI